MIDRFSRWPEAVPLVDATVDSVVTALYSAWICRFGAPTTITTDRGAQFESQIFQSLTNLIGCKRIRTTAYHSASNGLVERWHRSLKSAIMCHNTEDWVAILPAVLLGLRCSFKEDIKATAAEMLYGVPVRLPGEFFVNPDSVADPCIFIDKFRTHMQRIQLSGMVHHGERKHFVPKDLLTCSHVFLRVDHVRKPLEPPYEGPYTVLKRSTDRVIVIEVKGKATSVSIERLKPAFVEREQQTASSFKPLRTYSRPKAAPSQSKDLKGGSVGTLRRAQRRVHFVH